MNEREFASRLLNDKGFIAEAAMKIPEGILRKLGAESKAQAEAQKRGEQPNAADMGELMSRYFAPVGSVLGFGDVNAQALQSEIDSQFEAMGMMAKIKFGVRYAKAIAKANKQYGIK